MDDIQHEANQNTKYCSIKEDMKALLNLVNTYVKVHLIKNCSYLGFIHSIDPVSHSIILSIPQEDNYQTVIIPGHAVLDVSNEDLPDNIRPPQKKKSQLDSTEDIMKRKITLMSWLKTNLLPVTELDNKIIIGNVTVLPPYGISDISTDNPIVSMQIKSVMERMPIDFEPK